MTEMESAMLPIIINLYLKFSPSVWVERQSGWDVMVCVAVVWPVAYLWFQKGRSLRSVNVILDSYVSIERDLCQRIYQFLSLTFFSEFVEGSDGFTIALSLIHTTRVPGRRSRLVPVNTAVDTARVWWTRVSVYCVSSTRENGLIFYRRHQTTHETKMGLQKFSELGDKPTSYIMCNAFVNIMYI